MLLTPDCSKGGLCRCLVPHDGKRNVARVGRVRPVERRRDSSAVKVIPAICDKENNVKSGTETRELDIPTGPNHRTPSCDAQQHQAKDWGDECR